MQFLDAACAFVLAISAGACSQAMSERRSVEKRILLQAAHRDLNWNERNDNWFAEDLETAAALARVRYDFRLVVGTGRSPNHGGVLLPDTMRWLWSDSLP